jgi:hypothetical protein
MLWPVARVVFGRPHLLLFCLIACCRVMLIVELLGRLKQQN